MPWKPETEFDEKFGPTLGWYAIDWIEAMFSKPGAGEYDPYQLYEEMKIFLLNFYAIDPKRGKQRYNRGVLSRPRGWGKSPNVGVMLMLEGLGDVVFDGWDANGQPVGKPWSAVTLPNITLAAVSQDQTDNTWDPLKDMLEVSPVMEYYDGIIPRASEIVLPRGKVQKITASASSAKGKGSVFCALDQTESWVPSNGGIKLYNVLSSNVAKMGGRYIETPNAFYHGEDSVAENSYNYWRMAQEGRLRAPRLYYDHREAPGSLDIEVYDELIEALRISYGDASGDHRGCAIHMPPCEPGHKDIEILADTIMDPNKEEADTRADFLNQVVSAADAWLQHDEITKVIDGNREVSLSEPIVLGFDGSKGRVRGKADATALVGLTVTDGHFFHLGLWEEPFSSGVGQDPNSKWVAPVAEIDARVDQVHNTYNVVGFFGDPSGWEVQMADWEAKYGHRYEVKASPAKPITIFPRGKGAAIHENLVQLRSAIINRECTTDGSPGIIRHMENARRRSKKGGYLLYKETPQSQKKIDMAYAMTMAWMARVVAIRKGVDEYDGIPVSREVKVFR